ncbi:MAG: ATP-binding protein [Dehalococcoidia bacterium]
MNEEEFAALLALGHEVTGTEFKGSGPASDRHLFAKVARAVLGMANRRDGGRVIIGVEDNGGTPNPVGLAKPDLDTWKYDDVAAKFAKYADPSVNFELKQEQHIGKDFVILYVAEFEEIPVLCKQDYNKDKQVILRKGACYVRSRRKPETTEIPTQEDMRDLLDLAAEKRLRRYLEQAKRAGGLIVPFQTERLTPSPRELYDKQLGGL